MHRMAKRSRIRLSSKLLMRWQSRHNNRMSWLLCDFKAMGKNRRYSFGMMNLRLKLSVTPQTTHRFSFGDKSYCPGCPIALPLGSKVNRIRRGSLQTKVASPFLQYHSAFVRSIVQRSSPSGACKNQINSAAIPISSIHLIPIYLHETVVVQRLRPRSYVSSLIDGGGRSG